LSGIENVWHVPHYFMSTLALSTTVADVTFVFPHMVIYFHSPYMETSDVVIFSVHCSLVVQNFLNKKFLKPFSSV